MNKLSYRRSPQSHTAMKEAKIVPAQQVVQSQQKRLTIRIPQLLLVEFKKKAIENGKCYSKLAEEIFGSYLRNPSKTRKNGLPAQYPGSPTRLAVYLSQGQILKLKHRALDEEKSISELAEELFAGYLQHRKNGAL